MNDFNDFKPGYMQSIDMSRCRAGVHDSGRGCSFHQCKHNKNLLTHDGKLYCKRHHQPSIEDRNKAARRCTYKLFRDGTQCGAVLKKDNNGVWCQDCQSAHAIRVREAKVRAYDRVAKLLASVKGTLPLTAALQKAIRLKGVR